MKRRILILMILLVGASVAGITSANEQVLSRYVASDGQVVSLTRISEDSISGATLFALRIGEANVLTINTQIRPNPRITVVPVRGTSLELESRGSGTTWESVLLTYGSERAIYDTLASAGAQQEAQEVLGSLISTIRESDLGWRIELLQGALDTVDPTASGTRVLWLLTGISRARKERVGVDKGTIIDYMNCLRQGCGNAGGDWSSSGCHCNPKVHGWGYCAASAAVYFMESQRCWWKYVMPPYTS